MKLMNAFEDTDRIIRLLQERTEENRRCSTRMREYAETICVPRVTDATEVPLTPFAMLLAEAVR